MGNLWSKHFRLFLPAIAFGAVLVAGPALAEGPKQGEWQFSVTPYIWAAGLEGDVTVKGRASSVDASFLDIVETADSIFGFMGVFEARKGDWSAFVAPMYLNIGVDENVGIGPLTIDADVTVEMTIIEFGVSYRLVSSTLGSDTGEGGGQPAWIDAIAGARYTSLDGEIDLKVSAPSLGLSGTRVSQGSRDWTDPFVGARARAPLTENVWVQARGDVGGFGVGSDFSWQALGLLGYDFEMFGRDASIAAGYRALSMDFEEGSGSSLFQYNITMHGPIIALQTRF